MPRNLICATDGGPVPAVVRLLREILLVCAVLASAACQSADVVVEAETGQLLYPEPPETTRYRYVFELRKSTDIQPLSSTDKLLELATNTTSMEYRFLKPFGIAARAGRVFVSDSLLKVVHVYDVPRRRYFQFGLRREGALKQPLGLDVDQHNQVYVADGIARRVIVFDTLGLYLRDIGGETNNFAHPIAVACNKAGDRVYVLDNPGIDSDQHRVLMFDGEGAYLGTIGRRGSAPGEFNLPRDLTVGPDGTLFVLDGGNFRVQAFDPDGNFLFAWGAAGNRPGQFARGRAIATDDAGHVFVTDATFGNIQIFTDQGQLLMAMGRVGYDDLPGNFAMIAGIAADELGQVYAVDQVFKRVSIFAPEKS